ncbi:aminotransferase class I/II-fold pyridoxal phosphate-dependent enzyme [Primorskyibacter aestuariivivens]|uniref:serine hydroxymethyltransferase n=1 Tax=Primorskyibacter aestuariivivens TaxID=1888912 RepID=UPI00230123D0|nr:aminotransferase class I/II-fold pyridoxal phosphate-dependent enzyme [Primorskyibacter aestuariivivens]MDA7427273.1 aminotransferase class I/II-fold pyridoxal phosphate-dependent enzyme [Primorskyibacter aestuariivivens]
MSDETAKLASRDWLPETSRSLIDQIARQTARNDSAEVSSRVETLAAMNRRIHERECFNLNPATNVMNPRAEALLASGIGTRPSLGYPGDKYEMGLEAIEEIEVIAAELACEIFDATHAEIRVPSGAIANLYGFMATCKPGDAVIVPPAVVGGHVTHHEAGAAGLYGLQIFEAPVDEDGYTVDLNALADLAEAVEPRLITIGGSLNLSPHPVAGIRQIADRFGASVLFDAAHQCGIIAGRAWPNPLDEGAHLMTMSTYKSLGGPPSGLIVTRDAALAQRLEQIAFPGMTANFDAAKSAALAVSLLDWRDHGTAYAEAMVEMSKALAKACQEAGLPVFKTAQGATQSHQFALEATAFGGGQAASKKLRKAGFLACGIGLPTEPVEGDMNGLRIGTPELVRWGMTAEHAPELARLIVAALRANAPDTLAPEVAAWRASFDKLHFIHAG